MDNRRASSIWISASAGTGKTKSLIDRILKLLLSGVQPAKILCLTYTNAAATEMLIRLTDGLREIRSLSDEVLIRKLSSLGFDKSHMKIARSLYDKSFEEPSWVAVQTIHSFCFNLLERFPLETGLLPRMRLCDDYLGKKILQESLDQVLELRSSNWEIIAAHTVNIRDVLASGMMRLSRFIDCYGNFSQLYATFFNIDKDWMNLEDNQVDTLLFEQVFSNNHRKIFSELAQILAQGNSTDRKNAEILRKNTNNPTEEFTQVFLTKEGTLRVKLFSSRITDSNFFPKMSSAAAKALNFLERKKKIAAARANAAFFESVSEIVHRFRELKVANHCLDFNDVILRTLDLLKNSDWIRYGVDCGIDHVLVDEAQDTSPEQWEVIRAITGEFFSNYKSNRTIFVVGDEKQSIYSFQGANVKLFGQMQKHFQECSRGCGQNFHSITLNKSYRTTGNILSFVDSVFRDEFPGISHSTARKSDSGTVEILDVLESSKNLSSNIADFVKKNLEKGVFVESRNRAAEAMDFLILFQRRNLRTMQSIINTLKKENISVTGVDRILLNDELIVEDLIALAEFCLFPLYDLMCARVLKSPIVGITEEKLMRICLARGDARLWRHIGQDYPKLQNYIDWAHELPPHRFFMRVLAETREKFVERLGEQCIEILPEFLNIVMRYEEENLPLLSNFLEWFRLFEPEIHRKSFADRNAVRLMTVHASKGLQSPFVILADCHFVHFRDDKLLQHKNGILFWDFASDYRSKEMEELCSARQREDEEEFLRLLYVAMTRAEDFLRVLAEKKVEKSWYNFLTRHLEKFTRVESERLYRLGNPAASARKEGL
ncbi:MAG: UvrD-helicase domain-containing protein [Holosporaceae bacterium]|jgi:ATP-dependent helicase/nuclease subunit A|nr:UvrD-helicase domain-containing protein [Holosporaceae bacterium]